MDLKDLKSILVEEVLEDKPPGEALRNLGFTDDEIREIISHWKSSLVDMPKADPPSFLWGIEFGIHVLERSLEDV